MNEAEIAAELKRIARLIPGGRGELYASMDSNGSVNDLVSVGIYPTGILGEPWYARGATFAEALSKAEASVHEKAASLVAETIRKMALAIIEITADRGRCTDAALRVEGFTQTEIEAHHKAAVARAEEMAGSGPFSVAFLAVNSNAPEAS